MINWSEVAPVLVTLFSNLALDESASPEFLAQWSEGKREFVHPDVGKSLTLKVTSVVGIGDDEPRYENITVTPDEGDPYTMLQETLVGHRRFVLQVKVESHEHAPDETRWCWSMIERIRTRLLRTSSQQALQAVNVALIDTGAATDASFTFDKRRWNAAVMDVTLYAAFSDTDTVEMNWIERVELTSQISDPADNLLPTPPNVADMSVPEQDP